MTGCGEGFADNQGVACRVEIRSVNHRHLKCSIRTREGFHLLEPRLEGLIRERIKRGSLQITLEVNGSAVPTGRRLDQDQLGAYLDDWESFCDRRGITTPATIDPLLSLPGVLLDAPPDASAVEATWPVVAAATSAAVKQLDTMRQSEGTALVTDLEQACVAIGELVQQIRKRVPEVVAEHRQRLLDRVAKVLETHQTRFVGGMAKFHFPHASGQIIKEKGCGILIVPHMGAGTITRTESVHYSLPAKHRSVLHPEHGLGT